MLDRLLKPYQRFGVHLGLERIQRLLAALDNPQQRVPTIHVAGSNGKGSTCAYLATVLTAAGYRVGRYSSPHLIDWTERIYLGDRPISDEEFARLLEIVGQAIPPGAESPTQFEVITAAAWLYFAESQVDVAVIEVGLGGRLDATNVCDRPLVSVITSISREHWQQLGPTLADIAREKAGILKANCPAVIAPQPASVATVIAERTQLLHCPTIWVAPAVELPSRQGVRWASHKGIDYPLSLLGEVQLINSALAIAALQILQQQGWQVPLSDLQAGMAKAQLPGRLQWVEWRDRRLLVDGAHNPAAAESLRHYVDTLNLPITWVVGMLCTKDSDGIFEALLRPSDELLLVPVPDHSTADPEALAKSALQLCPALAKVQTFPDVFTALAAATDRQVVLCGSLYLVGYFLRFYRT